MAYIFLSYKREDFERARGIASVFAAHGLEVWWDQEVAGGEAWRSRIEQALDGAACVVVLWTKASTGAEGGFVRDEAARARARGLLVPVRFDHVAAPLGFGEVQAIDFSSWRGGSSARPVKDLVEAVRAKLEGRPARMAKRLMGPLARRIAALCGIAAILFCGFVVAANMFGAQDRLCAAPIIQPALSDACGAVGLGGRPTRIERIAWETAAKDDPAALRAHIRRFPEGAFREVAADLLLALEHSGELSAPSPDTRRLSEEESP